MLPLVVLIAVGWHLGVLWLERSRKVYVGPPLAEVLRLVELDLQRTLENARSRNGALLEPKPDGDAIG